LSFKKKQHVNNISDNINLQQNWQTMQVKDLTY